jgi:hypothetical protein
LTSPDLLYKLSHDDSIRGDVSPSTSTDLLKGLRGSPVLNIEDSVTQNQSQICFFLLHLIDVELLILTSTCFTL